MVLKYGQIKAVHGKNPMNLVEKILQTRIFRNAYWKDKCFALTAESLAERGMDLTHVGGTYGGNKKPTPFICLILAMLQIQPEKEIILEFILNEEYKYVRCLGAFYLRLVGTPVDIYKYLEPLYYDYRKLRKKTDTGYIITYMDEFVDELLSTTYSCDIALPHLPKRWILEENGQLPPRVIYEGLNLEDENKNATRTAVNSSSSSSSSDSDSDDSSSDNSDDDYYRRRSKRSDDRRYESRNDRSDDRRSDRRDDRRDDRRRDDRIRDDRDDRRDKDDRRRDDRRRDDKRSDRRDDRRDDRRRDDRRRDDRDDRRDKDDRRDDRRRDDRKDERRRNESKIDKPPKKMRKEEAPPPTSSSNSKGEVSMSIEETNRMRIAMGLKPLKM